MKAYANQARDNPVLENMGLGQMGLADQRQAPTYLAHPRGTIIGRQSEELKANQPNVKEATKGRYTLRGSGATIGDWIPRPTWGMSQREDEERPA